jgi:hypothetical protein
MGLLEELLVTLPMHHLVLSVRLNGSRREVIELGELFATGDEVFFVDHVHIEAGIVIIDVFVQALTVHRVHFLWSKHE